MSLCRTASPIRPPDQEAEAEHQGAGTATRVTTPTGRFAWPDTFPEPHHLPTEKPDRIRSMEGLNDSYVADGVHPLVDVDYSRIERRVLVMGGRGHAKTLAMLAQMEAAEAQIKQAFAVPAEYLGQEADCPLTGDELRCIMEQQPEFREPPARSKPPKNPFAEGSIKRYCK